jgi:hypothetical protein
MNCLEEVCGACSMVINGRARQSCSAIVDQLEQPIRLEPMSILERSTCKSRMTGKVLIGSRRIGCSN